MARGRIRTTNKGTFTEEQMKNAVNEVVKYGGSLRKTAERYNLKFQTLARYVSKQKQHENENIRMIPKYDCRKIFTAQQELLLVEYIVKCSQMCYGQTTFNVRTLAYEMATMNNINIPESWKRDKRAGLEWLHGFFKRHPNISVRRPESCSLSRMTAFNRSNITIFFKNLRNILERCPEKFADGSRIFNLDETSTTTVQKCRKIIATKGIKQVSRAVSGERGTLVTTCCIISAGGNALPPAMVFPRKKFKNRMIKDAPPGTLGLVSNSGWMTSEIFPEVMRHFIKYSHSNKQNPSLLIYDNHESHISIEAIRDAKENGVTILTLPPHSSHKIQPLDVAVFLPFKSYYNAAVDTWMIKNPGQTVSIYEVAEFVSKAHDRSMTPQNIRAGFRKTGIFPFDQAIFSDDDFLPSSVSDRPMPDPALNQPGSSTSSNGPRKNTNRQRKKGKSFIPTDTPEKENLEEIECKKRKKEEEKAIKKVKRRVLCEKRQELSESSDNADLSISSGKSSEYDVDEEIERVQDERIWEGQDKSYEKNDFVLVKFVVNKKESFYIGKILDLKENDEIEVQFL
ncbi:hypothetical protein NQ315_012996 [Exocentrus adspersus]|uniref:DDE-1 domain-containing protein n=1 Tax=Exocentrus adspersus TaxID=1586481 RepID=A0AAV8VSP5_9CUCU|nr:hypothetical protein NQ315_012996 [Exocentrus adspersus]